MARKAKTPTQLEADPPENHVPVADVEELLEQGADLRLHLDETLWPEFRAAYKVFKATFGERAANMKLLSDMVYYQCGYPLPSSRPKAEVLGKRAAQAFRLLYNIGREEDLNKWFRELGLEVKVVDERKARLKCLTSKPSKEAIKFRNEYELPAPKWEARSVLQWLVDFTCKKQATICQTANVIKKDLYSKALQQLHAPLRKGHFKETVALRARSKRVGRHVESVEHEALILSEDEIQRKREKVQGKRQQLGFRARQNAQSADVFKELSFVAAGITPKKEK